MPAHLLVAEVGPEPEVVHGQQDAPLRRFEAVAHVRQGPADDDAHGVAEVAILEFILDIERRLIAIAARQRGNGRRQIGGGSCIRQGGILICVWHSSAAKNARRRTRFTFWYYSEKVGRNPVICWGQDGEKATRQAEWCKRQNHENTKRESTKKSDRMCL